MSEMNFCAPACMICKKQIDLKYYCCKECVERTQWISVKDRLPTPKEYVFLWLPKVGSGICAIGCRDIPIRENYDYSADSTNDYFSRGYRYRQDDVSHWMPLPQPPEVKE